MILAFHVGDFAAVAIIVIIIGCSIGGMVKFLKAIKVLKKGPPEGDPKIAAEQEQEFQNHEQDD